MTTTMENSFSFNRMLRFGRLYLPAIRTQLLIYFVIILLFYVLSSFSIVYLGSIIPAFAVSSIIISYMVYMGPVVYSRYSDEIIPTQLPALRSEKALFTIAYPVVVVPLFVIGVWGICCLAGAILPFDGPEFMTIFGRNSTFTQIYEQIGISDNLTVFSTLSGWLLVLSITLYVTISSTRKRALMCFVAALLTNIAAVVIGIIIGVIALFRIISQFSDDPVAAQQMLEEIAEAADADAIAAPILDFLVTLSTTVSAISVVATIVLLYLSWRKICNRQV